MTRGLLPDIRGEDDVAALVADFYDQALADPLLGPLFVDVARVDLGSDLPVMQDFWMTVLFRAGRYRRMAGPPPSPLGAGAGAAAGVTGRIR